MKIELTGEQLNQAIADYLGAATVGGTPSALLSHIAEGARRASMAMHDRGALTDAAWVDAFADRINAMRAPERAREAGFYLGAVTRPDTYEDARTAVDLWLHQNPTVR